MSNTQRKIGYYHVMFCDSWFIGYFGLNRKWSLAGASQDFDDSHFSEINENRILSPDEPTLAMSMYKNKFIDELRRGGVSFTDCDGCVNYDDYDYYKDDIEGDYVCTLPVWEQNRQRIDTNEYLALTELEKMNYKPAK